MTLARRRTPRYRETFGVRQPSGALLRTPGNSRPLREPRPPLRQNRLKAELHTLRACSHGVPPSGGETLVHEEAVEGFGAINVSVAFLPTASRISSRVTGKRLEKMCLPVLTRVVG